MKALTRTLSLARRHGVSGAARIAGRRAQTTLKERLFLDEEHLWYVMELPAPSAAPFGAEDGLRLISPSTPAELALFGALPTVTPAGARARRRDGGEPWLVLDGATPLFACWIFPRRTPMIAAGGGWLELPAGVVCLEDSVAAPAARGRGIAPRTWRALADRYAGLGAAAIVTKVATDNAPSRRAVGKAGFREIAVQRYRRRGPRAQVRVEVLEPGVADILAARLAR